MYILNKLTDLERSIIIAQGDRVDGEPGLLFV